MGKNSGIFVCVLILVLPHLSSAQKAKDIPTLLEELTSEDPVVSGAASVELLKHAPYVNPSIVRLASSTAARVKEDRATPWLVKIARNAFETDREIYAQFDASTRAIATLSLGKIITWEEKEKKVKLSLGDNVVKAMLDILSPTEPLQVRIASAWSLQYTLDKKAVPVLKGIVKDTAENPLVKLAAAESLTKIKSYYAFVEGKAIKDPPSDPDPVYQRYVTTNAIIGAQIYMLLRFGNVITIPGK